MKWVIRTTHRRNGNTFYFVRLTTVDGVTKPINCMKYRAIRGAATTFPSIAAACAVVRQISQDDWTCRIRPATCLAFRGGAVASSEEVTGDE